MGNRKLSVWKSTHNRLVALLTVSLRALSSVKSNASNTKICLTTLPSEMFPIQIQNTANRLVGIHRTADVALVPLALHAPEILE